MVIPRAPAFSDGDDMPSVSIDLEQIIVTLDYVKAPLTILEAAIILGTTTTEVLRCLATFPDGWWSVEKYIDDKGWKIRKRKVRTL